ncbi:hypothetical protein Tco_1418551 [Tanacetum coccineum]
MDDEQVSTGSEGVSTASRIFSTTEESVSTAGASMPVSTASMIQQVNIIIPSSSENTKDKGKSIMQESKQPKKIKNRVQIHMSLDEKLAQKLHEEEQARFNAEQEAKFYAEQEELLASKTTEDEANTPATDINWDDVQAQIQADEDLDQITVELKRLFEPDTDDILWKLQRYMHNPLTWRLFDTCGVHHVSTDRGHDIFILVEKDYPPTIGLLTLMLCNKLQVDQYSEMADELLRKIVILANRPRQ